MTLYSYGAASRRRLDTCHRDLQVLFDRVIHVVDCSILEGHRGQERQDQLFRNNATRATYPNSRHNSKPSMAVDAAPYPIDWEDISRFNAFAGIVQSLAAWLWNAGEITHHLRWGGDWDRDGDLADNEFDDLVHFELVKE